MRGRAGPSPTGRPASQPDLAIVKAKGGKNETVMPTYIHIALTAKAWNLYREGVSTKTLRFTAGGAKPDKFPEPR